MVCSFSHAFVDFRTGKKIEKSNKNKIHTLKNLTIVVCERNPLFIYVPANFETMKLGNKRKRKTWAKKKR